jgi:hypothetical protein
MGREACLMSIKICKAPRDSSGLAYLYIDEVTLFNVDRKIVSQTHLLHVNPENLMLEIPRGTIENKKSFNKFGTNTDIAVNTTEDVWNGG